MRAFRVPARLAALALALVAPAAFAQAISVTELPPSDEMLDAAPDASIPARAQAQESTAETAPQEPPAPKPNAIALRGLNKVTARIETLEAPLGTVMRFGGLEIIAHRCWQSAPGERPESAGLLEIWESKPGEGPQRIFLGWMFASSPALLALEHPVYDVTVVSCLVKDVSAE